MRGKYAHRAATEAGVAGAPSLAERSWSAMQIVRLLKQTWLEWYQSRAFEFGAALAFYDPSPLRR